MIQDINFNALTILSAYHTNNDFNFGTTPTIFKGGRDVSYMAAQGWMKCQRTNDSVS